MANKQAHLLKLGEQLAAMIEHPDTPQPFIDRLTDL